MKKIISPAVGVFTNSKHHILFIKKNLFLWLMEPYVPNNYISFFTSTILEWRRLLHNDKYKDKIIDSMKFLPLLVFSPTANIIYYLLKRTYFMVNGNV